MSQKRFALKSGATLQRNARFLARDLSFFGGFSHVNRRNALQGVKHPLGGCPLKRPSPHTRLRFSRLVLLAQISIVLGVLAHVNRRNAPQGVRWLPHGGRTKATKSSDF